MTETTSARRRASARPTASEAAREASYDPPYLAAAIAGLSVWLLYFITLAPTTAFWDTSEYIATAHILGIPHPPGNPTFVVLARAWEMLLTPFGLSVAQEINLFSATMSALAHGFWFLVAHRIVSFMTADRRLALLGASLAVLVSATAFTVWSQSNVNEKVYTVSLFTIALLTWLAFLWRSNIGKGKDDNLILLMVFILALSVGNHLMAFLVAPAMFVFIMLIESRTLANWKLYAFGLMVALLGLSIHLYLPLRAGLGPIINEAAPTCETVGSALVSILTYGNAGCEALSESLSRTQYDKPSVFTDPTNPELPRTIGLILAQVGNYFQYFDWQWARTLNAAEPLFGGATTPGGPFPWRPFLTLVFVALGLYGATEHWRRDRTSFWYISILLATVSIGLVGYLNFKYGYTYPQPGGGYDIALHEVRERDYFFIVSFSMWGLWTGIGIFAFWRDLAGRLAEWTNVAADRQRLALASPVLLLALVPAVANWERADRSYDYAARDWAYNMLMSVEPYGVLFTNGDNDTFPLWYLQEVEEIRRDVTVIVMSYLNTPWYAKQLKHLTAPCDPGEDPLEDPTRITCQRPFQPENEAEFYTAGWTPGSRDTGATPVGIGPATDEGAAGTEPATAADLDAAGMDAADQDAAAPADTAAAGDTLPPATPMAPLRIVPEGGWTRPQRSILANMTDSRIDSIPALYASNPYNFLIEEPVTMRAGDLTFTIPGNRVLLPADVFLLNIIQNAVGDRPVYFATTTQAYDRLGLGANLVRHGLALKLVKEPVVPSAERGIYALPETLRLPGPFLDLPRTDALLWDVYVHRSGIPDEWGFWPEPSTRNIPLYYMYTHYAAYAAHLLRGEEELAERHAERVEAWDGLSQR